MVTIEIDGKKVEVEDGSMVIEAADQAGITIPRFCYHKKLSVAANCRMCLVEFDNARKPMPACATPVTDGMKVFTRSKIAVAAQKAIMEFLLINHPLDCPICDQGGECELQDVSMGYGQDLSRYSEGKRSVVDDDLGSLIATEMTRCIHCTRCVRFGQEVAGMRELGATGRGEHTQIGTFVKHSVNSEVSGNVIDLCPVGALTSKPYRFTARAWELSQAKHIAPHDCLGSHTLTHVRRGEVMRVVPDDFERLNETWLSDRDRFAYTGVHHSDRLAEPMVKIQGQWRTVSWQDALQAVQVGMERVNEKHGVGSVGGLISPSATTEEAYLFQQLIRGIGSEHIDYRIHQQDFSVIPALMNTSVTPEAIEQADMVVLIGSDIQREQPLLGLRVRKATLRGAKVACFNERHFDFNFDVDYPLIDRPESLIQHLAYWVEQVTDKPGSLLPEGVALDSHQQDLLAASGQSAKQSQRVVVLLGALAQNHPYASDIFSACQSLSQHCSQVSVAALTEGANAMGCTLAGAHPTAKHGGNDDSDGEDVQAMLQSRKAAYLIHQLEPDLDLANPAVARQALLAAEFVVVCASYLSPATQEYADVLLPIATPYETSGTYVNFCGDWQSFKGVIPAYAQARPAWKVYRVLGNHFGLADFDYTDSSAVLVALKQQLSLSPTATVNFVKPQLQALSQSDLSGAAMVRVGGWPMYRADNICRHSEPLQCAAANESLCVRMNPEDAQPFADKPQVTISQGDIEITLPLVVDEALPQGCVYVAGGWHETSDLGLAYQPIMVRPVD